MESFSYTISQKSTTKMSPNQFLKWVNDLNRYFSQKVIHMANKHMKKMLNVINSKEMQIKTTMRYHHIPIRVVTLKRKYPMLVRMWNKLEPFHTVDRNAKCCSYYRKQYDACFKN
jgi:hypothetical protein